MILSISSKAARCPRRAELAEVEMEATQLLPTHGNNILSCLITSKNAFLGRISSVFHFLSFIIAIVKHFVQESSISEWALSVAAGAGANEVHNISMFAQNVDRPHSSIKSTSFCKRKYFCNRKYFFSSAVLICGPSGLSLVRNLSGSGV